MDLLTKIRQFETDFDPLGNRQSLGEFDLLTIQIIVPERCGSK